MPNETPNDFVHWTPKQALKVSAMDLVELMENFILARLKPEVKKLDKKYPHCFTSADRKNLAKHELKVEICSHDVPYDCEKVEVIPYNLELQAIYDGAAAIRKELQKDPVCEDYW